jgi:CheY-like chemotaxis protein
MIVMIDDNPSDLRLTRRMLQSSEDLDYQIVEATTGRGGLKAIYNYHPDLIILDLMLPDVDGFSILETLKNDPKLADIPVVVVSAKTPTPAERAALEDGIRSIVEKASLDRKQLLDIIKGELTQ